MFNPQVSNSFQEHYLEMCKLEPKELISDYSLMPSSQNLELGRCPICPAFTFLSKTEKKRHNRIFLPTDSPKQTFDLLLYLWSEVPFYIPIEETYMHTRGERRLLP